MGKISVIIIACLACAFFANVKLESKEPHCWIWFKEPNLDKHACSELYLLQGRFFEDKVAQPRFHKKGASPDISQSKQPHSLVFRIDNLLTPDFVSHHVQRVIERWKIEGITITSVQFDYDSPSSKLLEYANFLAQVKLRLPKTSISSTALVSWYHDNPMDLIKVSEQVDFIAIQLYSVIKPHNDYLEISKQLSSYPRPYRLGITTHPEFDIKRIKQGNHFLGFSLFLSK